MVEKWSLGDAWQHALSCRAVKFQPELALRGLTQSLRSPAIRQTGHRRALRPGSPVFQPQADMTGFIFSAKPQPTPAQYIYSLNRCSSGRYEMLGTLLSEKEGSHRVHFCPQRAPGLTGM